MLLLRPLLSAPILSASLAPLSSSSALSSTSTPPSFYASSPLTSLPPLAHVLMSSLLPSLAPGDCVVDATAGNGSDSHFLASEILRAFPDPTPKPTLLCLDVQAAAVDKTKRRLEPFPFADVQLRSHSPLLPPTPSLALAVYNLGYLPNHKPNPDEARVATQTASSLSSLAEALDALSPDGAVFVTSYPASNADEHAKVMGLADSVARLSSRSPVPVPGVGEGKAFRVFHHEPAGRESSPVLTTLTRIK
jgi:hypothetical protein